MITWKDVLYDETKKQYYRRALSFVKHERERKEIYPPRDEMFSCFKLTPLKDVKVVIVGQDPYHTPHRAHGMAFSVKHGFVIPPSLKNIFAEINRTIDSNFNPTHGNLTSWAEQGVLLLNTVLTVERGKPASHANIGWELFTDKVITIIDDIIGVNCVFMLWGNYAMKKASLIRSSEVLITSHPSPYSVNNGFCGCDHFRKANRHLLESGRPDIIWNKI